MHNEVKFVHYLLLSGAKFWQNVSILVSLHETCHCRVQHRFQNITCWARQTCPATLLNKGWLHCEYSAQNITCRERQVRVLFCLPDCHFLPNLLATCNRASGYVVCCADASNACPHNEVKLVHYLLLSGAKLWRKVEQVLHRHFIILWNLWTKQAMLVPNMRSSLFFSCSTVALQPMNP